MNKLQGFLELKRTGLPSVPWQRYYKGVHLDPEILWTIRSAVTEGDDLNLPRKIGVTSDEAILFANELIDKLGVNDLVIYYPYFIAEKSGVIEISLDRIVIEAVKNDLWNLVTNNCKDVTIVFSNEDLKFHGNEKFLNHNETIELIDYCIKLKKRFYQYICNKQSVFLEWSYSYQSDINKNKIGDCSLVFYEIRTVN